MGGPASHAPELGAFLQARGHQVEAVVTADRPPPRGAYPVRWVSRRLPVGARHAAVALLVARRARWAEVVYATSMVGRAALGSALAGRPLVVKLTTDEAYERARRRGLFSGDLDAFQRARGGVAIALLRAGRDVALRQAKRVICPSAYLRELALSWGVPAERLALCPNPAPEIPALPDASAARAALGLEGGILAFAGRIGRQKALEVALEAVAQVEGVSLLVAGDGPERAEMEERCRRLSLGDRVRFLGALPRQRVLELFRAADATVLSSTWENFPHAVVESLAVGTPVIATAVGGVAEVVEDGVNGLLVPPGDPQALARAIRRLYGEPGLRDRLAARARASVAHHSAEAVYGRIEALLREVATR